MMTTTGDAVIDTYLSREMNAGSLKHTVSTAIWCPRCSSILDVRRAVETTIWRDPPSPDQLSLGGEIPPPSTESKCLMVGVLCATCHDNEIEGMRTLAAAKRLRLEIIDGRVLHAPKPKSPPQRNPVRKGDVVKGGVYTTKISGKPTEIRIESDYRAKVPGSFSRPGWRAINLTTGRDVWITSAARLSGRVR